MSPKYSQFIIKKTRGAKKPADAGFFFGLNLRSFPTNAGWRQEKDKRSDHPDPPHTDLLRLMAITDPLVKRNLVETVVKDYGLGLFLGFSSAAVARHRSGSGQPYAADRAELRKHHLSKHLPGAVCCVPGVLVRGQIGEHQKLDRANHHIEARRADPGNGRRITSRSLRWSFARDTMIGIGSQFSRLSQGHRCRPRLGQVAVPVGGEGYTAESAI